ncbi:MAG: hypothetical protein IH870_08405, partial [Chloroflexi bacterium]|nr:hypothetical protein [Chloroflexota bacterium]
HYINVNLIATNTDAVGDMNVMLTRDTNWCLDMEGTNISPVTGAVHAYANYSVNSNVGLFIWNGLDVDQIGSDPAVANGNGFLARVWLQELEQPFNPSALPCTVSVVRTSVGGNTSFLVGDEGSSYGFVASIAGGIAGTLAIVGLAGGWYARKRRMEQRS